jgi:hypothetical protein
MKGKLILLTLKPLRTGMVTRSLHVSPVREMIVQGGVGKVEILIVVEQVAVMTCHMDRHSRYYHRRQDDEKRLTAADKFPPAVFHY